MVNSNIKIPDELHKKAKIKAMEINLTLKEFILESIEEKIDKEIKNAK